MRKPGRFLRAAFITAAFFLVPAARPAQTDTRAEVYNLRYYTHPNFTRIVVDIGVLREYTALESRGAGQINVDIFQARLNPIVNEGDRSVKVIAEVENSSEQLKAGLYVKGRILTGKRTGVLRVPRTALLIWDVEGRKGDLFIVNGEIANRRTIGTGSVMGDFVEVISGLQVGEQVITRGGFNVKDGDRIRVTPVSGG